MMLRIAISWLERYNLYFLDTPLDTTIGNDFRFSAIFSSIVPELRDAEIFSWGRAGVEQQNFQDALIFF